MKKNNMKPDDRQTLSSSMSSDDHEDQDDAISTKSSGKTKSQTNVPPKYLATIFLSFGFLLIWSAILAAVVIDITLKNNEKTDELSSAFDAQKKLSNASFVIGKELVTTINFLKMKNNTEDAILAYEVLAEFQRETDEAIERLGHPSVLGRVLNQLKDIRYIVDVSKDPNEAIEFYYKLNEELMRLCLSMISQNHHELPSPTLGFIFLNQGMIKKFEEFALSSMYFNMKPLSSNKLMAQLISTHAQSEEYFKSSFKFVPKSKACWWELSVSDEMFLMVVNSVYFGTENAITIVEPKAVEFDFNTISRQLKNLDHIKTSMLKLFENEMLFLQKKSKNTSLFHMSLAITAFVVIVFSIVIIGCSLKEFSKPKPVSMPKIQAANSMMVCLDEKHSLPNTYICSPTFDPVITSDRRKSAMC